MKSQLLAAGLAVGLHLILCLALSLRYHPAIAPWQGPLALTMCQLLEQAPAATKPPPPAVATSDELSPPAGEPQPPKAVKAVPPEPLLAPVAQPTPVRPNKKGMEATGRVEKRLSPAPDQQPVTPPGIDHPAGSSSAQEQGTSAPAPAIPVNSTPALASNSSGKAAVPGPVKGQGSEVKPVYKETPEPQYPALARRMGYQGTVELQVLVGRKGTVEELHIVRSSGYPVLDNSAQAAVQRWSFEPGTRDTVQEAMWIKIPVHFRLR